MYTFNVCYKWYADHNMAIKLLPFILLRSLVYLTIGYTYRENERERERESESSLKYEVGDQISNIFNFHSVMTNDPMNKPF